MDENLIKDLLKIERLINKSKNIQEQVIGMGSETGLANTKTYSSPPTKKSTKPEKINMDFYLTSDYTLKYYSFQSISGINSMVIEPEKTITLKKGTRGNRTENTILVGGLKYQCGQVNDLLTKTNINNLFVTYNYTSPELIKTLKGVCGWTMSSYRELLKKETETKTDGTKTDGTKTDDTKTTQCSLDCNKRYPYYSVVCDGGNWKSTLKSWISEKGGGENKETYRALRTSWCSGWRPGQTQGTLIDFIPPIFPDSSTTTTTTITQNNQISVY